VARSFISPDVLKWDDYAEWHDAEHYCEWRIATRFFSDNVRCTGRSTFVEDGPTQTRVLLTGELNITLGGLRMVPRLLRSTVEPQIEKFIVALLTANLRRVNEGLQRFLDSLEPQMHKEAP